MIKMIGLSLFLEGKANQRLWLAPDEFVHVARDGRQEKVRATRLLEAYSDWWVLHPDLQQWGGIAEVEINDGNRWKAYPLANEKK